MASQREVFRHMNCFLKRQAPKLSLRIGSLSQTGLLLRLRGMPLPGFQYHSLKPTAGSNMIAMAGGAYSQLTVPAYFG